MPTHLLEKEKASPTGVKSTSDEETKDPRLDKDSPLLLSASVQMGKVASRETREDTKNLSREKKRSPIVLCRKLQTEVFSPTGAQKMQSSIQEIKSSKVDALDDLYHISGQRSSKFPIKTDNINDGVSE